MNRPAFLLLLTAFLILLLSVFMIPNFADFDEKISNYHLRNALRDTEAPNVVTTIVWDYWAYDTLGEETILFAATLGIYAIFRSYVKTKKKKLEIFGPKIAKKISKASKKVGK